MSGSLEASEMAVNDPVRALPLGVVSAKVLVRDTVAKGEVCGLEDIGGDEFLLNGQTIEI